MSIDKLDKCGNRCYYDVATVCPQRPLRVLWLIPYASEEKPTLYAIYSVLVTTLHKIEPELIVQGVEL